MRLAVHPVLGLPEIRSGDDLAALVAAAEPGLHDGDVLVVTSKVVSKAEGQVRAMTREDAVTAETVRLVACRGDTRIVETRHGLVMAAAGVDASNVEPGTVVLLPVDPDASARRLRAALHERLGVRVAVLVSDTMGRPWRAGLVDVAIGCAGLEPAEDLRGRRDAYGNDLSMTVTAVADEIAAAGELVKGKLGGIPVAVVRGLGHLVTAADGPGAAVLVRPAAEDMFRLGTAEAVEAGRYAALADIGRARADAEPPGAAASGAIDVDALRAAVEHARGVAATWGGQAGLDVVAPAHATHGGDEPSGVVVTCAPGAELAAGATVAALLVALGAADMEAVWSAYQYDRDVAAHPVAVGIVRVRPRATATRRQAWRVAPDPLK